MNKKNLLFVIQLSILFFALQSSVIAADSVSFGQQLLGLLLPLLLVIGLLIGTLVLLQRRYQTGKLDGPLTIAQVLPVGAKQRIIVLQEDSRSFAVGVTSESIHFLTELSNTETKVVGADVSHADRESGI